VTVDIDRAGAQALRHAVRRRDIAAPDRGGEPVAHVVRDLHGLLDVAERDGREHGPEALLPRDLHVRVDVREHRGLHEEPAAVLAHAAAAQPHLGAVLPARFDVAHDRVELYLVHDGPEARLWIQRVPWGHAPADL